MTIVFVMKKTIVFLGLFAVLLFGIISPVSAVTVTVGDAVYTVSPMAKNSGDYSVMALPIIGSIFDGETKSYIYDVDSGSTELEIELSWLLPTSGSALSISVFNPNGNLVGQYYDTYDGKEDGNIGIRISGNSLGGDWTIFVNGDNVVGIQLFTLTINEY